MPYENHLAGSEGAAIEYIEELIDKGRHLLGIKEHPGKTSEFVEWKQRIDTFVIRKYSENSFQWKQIRRTVVIPKWFDPKIHGKIEETGLVLTDAQESDRKKAFDLYKEGIDKFIAILNGIKDDIEISGLPSKPNLRSSPTDKAGNTIFSINPQFNQIQNQSQEQKMHLRVSIKEVRKTVEDILDNKQDIEKANKMLDELEKEAKEKKPKWSTAKKAAEMFLSFGRDAFISLLPVLLQVYGIIPPTP